MQQLQATQQALEALQSQVSSGTKAGGGKAHFKASGKGAKGQGKGGKGGPIAWWCHVCGTGHRNPACWTCRNWDCQAQRTDEETSSEPITLVTHPFASAPAPVFGSTPATTQGPPPMLDALGRMGGEALETEERLPGLRKVGEKGETATQAHHLRTILRPGPCGYSSHKISTTTFIRKPRRPKQKNPTYRS